MYLNFILLLAAILFPVGDRDVAPRLLWAEEQRLTWEHFQGTPELSSPYAALTKIDMSVAQGSLLSADSIELMISTELMLDGSWVKPDKKTALILEHEQGHFDIAEYHARRLRKEMLERSPFKAARFSEDVNLLFDRIFEEKEIMQRDYDRETDHSLRRAEQKMWDLRIANLLDSLSAYSQRSVILGLR